MEAYGEDRGSRSSSRASSVPSASSRSQPSNDVSYKLLLNQLLATTGSSPAIFKSAISSCDKKTSNKNYIASVSFNNEKINTHPTSYPSDVEAEEEVAKKAYDIIQARQGSLNNVAHVTVDDDKLIDNIIELLHNTTTKVIHRSGMPEEYVKRYNEQVPVNWFEMAKSSQRLEVEELEYTNKTVATVALPNPKAKKKPTGEVIPRRVIYDNENTTMTMHLTNQRVNYVAETKFSTSPYSAYRARTVSGGDDIKNSWEQINSTPIQKAILPRPNPAPVRDEDYFDVFVTLAATPNNFLIQPYKNLQPNGAFYHLNKEMQDFYNIEDNLIEINPDMIKEQFFFAAKFTDKLWYRIRVDVIINKDPLQIMAYFVDFGDLHSVEFKNIQHLYAQFRKLPMQAIHASLAVSPIGLDWDVLACYEFSKMVENKAFVAIVYAIERNQEKDPVVKLSLCDTSNDSTDVVIDRLLVNKGFARPTLIK